MRVFNTLSLLVALAQFIPSTLTRLVNPDTAPSLAARAQFCYNAPNTQAGSFLGRRTLGPGSLYPRDFPGTEQVNWCAPNCQTYISVTYGSAIPNNRATWATTQQLVAGAQAVCQQQIAAEDEFLPNGAWMYGRNYVGTNGLELQFSNSNNHQLTWGVLNAGLAALADYFDTLQNLNVAPGSVLFAIIDGPNEVGLGGFGTQEQ